MPGPYLAAEFNRSHCDVPGLYETYRYAPNLMAHMAIHWPSVTFQNAPVLVHAHGGLGYSPGWRSMYDIIDAGKMGKLCERLSALGWVIITIDYPTVSSNRSDGGNIKLIGTWSEIHPLAMWPKQAEYFARAIQHIKGNKNSETKAGQTMWGNGNSIDDSLVFTSGQSWGSTMALYMGLQPTGYYPFAQSLDHNGMDRMVPRASHRVKGHIDGGSGSQIDLTQFYIDTGYTSPLGEPYVGNRAQWKMRTESRRTWSGLPVQEKKQSPWWVLQEKHAENMQWSCFMQFLGLGTNEALWDANLSAADWSPGTTRTGIGTPGVSGHDGKAWIDPHDGRIQGQPWRDALLNYGSDAGAPIRKSVVRWAGGTGSAALFNQDNFVTRCLTWMRSINVPTQYAT